ncbi:MAG TPA: 3-dehydroquinate synthase [Polyangiales bacterium]|nr:3-dehydroquinate synthase [Polyangiales bacterium]
MVDRVILSGPMGSGKSRVARALGELWGTAPVDLDERIEKRAGMTIAQFVQQRGEPAFRALEREVAEGVLADENARIVALGGGTVTNASLRRRLLASGTLVTLRAPLDVLLARIGNAQSRPLLHGHDVRERLTTILSERAEAYAECHAELDTDHKDPNAVAQALDALVSDPPIVVPMGLRTYRVEVGPGVRHELVERVRRYSTGRHVVVVTDSGVREHWAERSARELSDAGKLVSLVCLPAGEEHKNIESIGKIWDGALEAGIDRDALVLAIGGGVVGDMAGFAASTLLRGIDCAQMPTTLLAMVDSAVGGKTGIDRPQGKNLVGAFQQPRFVLCDIEALRTLPLAERRAGLAEVVKSAWLDSDESVRLLEESAEGLVAGDLLATSAAVRMSVQLKARVVTEDEKETGVRGTLNLGHTVGHAIEAAVGLGALRHGECVALGMVAAFRLAAKLGRASAADGERITKLMKRLGLPTELDRYLDDRTLAFMGSDKKRKGGKLRFIVPGAPGATEIVPLSEDDVKRLVRI